MTSMRLAAPSVPVAKLLRLTGVDRSLTICPDLRGGLAVGRARTCEPIAASPGARDGCQLITAAARAASIKD